MASNSICEMIATRTVSRAGCAAAIMAPGVFLLLFLTGCGGKPFNVKPQVPLPAIPASAEAVSTGVSISAAIIRDEDFLLETFDANLVMAGVLPVSLVVTNRGSGPLDLSRASFSIRDGGGRQFKAAEPKRVYKRLVSYYGIKTWGKSAYKDSLADFSSYAFDTRTPIGVGESRRGMIFFVLPSAAAGAPGYKLVGSHLDAAQPRTAIELQLN